MARKSFLNLRVHSGILIGEMKNILAWSIFSSNRQRENKYSIIFKNLSSFPTVAAMTGSSVSNGLQNGNSANGTAATVNGCWTVGLINR